MGLGPHGRNHAFLSKVFFPVRASGQGSLLVLQTFGLTTSKIFKGLGGFPELQILRFQKHEFQLSIVLGLCGDSSTFYVAMLFQKVFIIICKSDLVQCWILQNFNISEGFMNKYKRNY